MQTLIDTIRSPLAFVAVLGPLVFFHELGHYLAARWRGVHVDVFSIGFGRALFSWTDRVGTVWKIGWIPLGGYVKLHGQERPEEVSDAERARWRTGETFHEKSVASRAIVVAAGPLANFLLAAVLFAGLFAAIGRPVLPPVVGSVVAGSAAAEAGLMPGDRVRSIDGAAVARFEDLQHIVAARPEQTVAVAVTRADAALTIPVHTGVREEGGARIGVLGVRAGATEFVRLDPARAVLAGVVQTADVTAQTFEGVVQMITGRRGTEDLGGPIRIAQLAGEVVQLGLGSLISLIAVLSVNLALINLFPIPVLDGGHLVFYLAEAVRGRPVPPRFQELSFRAGLAVLASLFVFATWNDTHNQLYGLFTRLFG